MATRGNWTYRIRLFAPVAIDLIRAITLRRLSHRLLLQTTIVTSDCLTHAILASFRGILSLCD
ncbi:MAG: hypothetical protein ACAF41_11120 [Leptolyngbya sp. BL-A-14]